MMFKFGLHFFNIDSILFIERKKDKYVLHFSENKHANSGYFTHEIPYERHLDMDFDCLCKKLSVRQTEWRLRQVGRYIITTKGVEFIVPILEKSEHVGFTLLYSRGTLPIECRSEFLEPLEDKFDLVFHDEETIIFDDLKKIFLHQ